MEKSSGQERTREFIEGFVALVARYPEKVRVEVREVPHQHVLDRSVTTFLIVIEDPRDAAILIGVGGKNVQTLREIVHVISCQQGFAPARVEIVDPLRSRRAREAGGGV